MCSLLDGPQTSAELNLLDDAYFFCVCLTIWHLWHLWSIMTRIVGTISFQWGDRKVKKNFFKKEISLLRFEEFWVKIEK